MMQTGTLRVLDVESAGVDADPRRESLYARADTTALADYDYPIPGFVDAVLDEIAAERTVKEARLLDELHDSPDVDAAYLLAFPDESLLFIGKDPTAKDAVPWFAFTVEPGQPLPVPTSCTDALDLLKPPEVQDLYYEQEFLPGRHGEWWLLPCSLVPGGSVFRPGVRARPYGPSPLGNHVPREYAFTVSDREFIRRFTEAADAPASIATPPEALRWTHRNLQKVNPPSGVPGWADIRAFAGEVLIRGTIRHRDDDHYVENCGEAWHKAQTHDIEVYTADSFGNVHLDYYGR